MYVMILPRTQITKRQTKPRMVSKWVTSDRISVFSLQVEMLNLLTNQNLGSCQSWLLRCWNTSKACWSRRGGVAWVIHMTQGFHIIFHHIMFLTWSNSIIMINTYILYSISIIAFHCLVFLPKKYIYFHK